MDVSGVLAGPKDDDRLWEVVDNARPSASDTGKIRDTAT